MTKVTVPEMNRQWDPSIAAVMRFKKNQKKKSNENPVAFNMDFINWSIGTVLQLHKKHVMASAAELREIWKESVLRTLEWQFRRDSGWWVCDSFIHILPLQYTRTRKTKLNRDGTLQSPQK